MTNPFVKLSVLFACLLFTFSATAETFQTIVETEIDIDKPITEVFYYATTAENWAKWHPNTYRTTGADDHSATENEQIKETLKIGFLVGPKLYWTVSKHIEPNQWQLNGKDQFGFIDFVLTYTFSMNEDGSTHFHREMAYELSDLSVFRLFDNLVFKPYNEFISSRALNKLKQAAESI